MLSIDIYCSWLCLWDILRVWPHLRFSFAPITSCQVYYFSLISLSLLLPQGNGGNSDRGLHAFEVTVAVSTALS